jgi:hypothetical protein
MRTAFVALAIAAFLPLCHAQQAPQDPTALARAVAGADRTYKTATTEPINPGMGVRELFTAALIYCEANVNLDRLPKLFEMAARMQDRDPESRSYGNFRWYWRDETVGDFNAADFTMQTGVLIWLRHRDKLTPAVEAQFRELLEYGSEGCQRHSVGPDYTNISLMNAADLILLGEALGKPDVAKQGYERLDWCVEYTYRYGVHEFDSPTYTEVDISDMELLEAFCTQDRARTQARAMLDLLYTDLACNWFPAASKLGGAQSRTYDYVRGLGGTEAKAIRAGWTAPPANYGIGIYDYLARYTPDPALKTLNQTRFPRLVQQSWGTTRDQFKIHYLLPDITLSTIGASYGGWMDMPLTVDLAAGRNDPRCYFIADGRDDPYGKAVVGAGIHKKAFHLKPFWAGNQRTVDAVGMAVYTQAALLPEATCIVSDFVMPAVGVSFSIGDQKVQFENNPPASYPVPEGTPVFLRKGTTALGIRVLWSRDVAGAPAKMELVNDGNTYGCARLAITHFHGDKMPADIGTPAVALWVRIGNGLTDDAAFEAWKKAFTTAQAQVTADAQSASFRVEGVDGPVAVSAAAPWTKATSYDPAPVRSVLSLDGKEIGRPILEPVKPAGLDLTQLPLLNVDAVKGLQWESESGALEPLMRVGEDPAASGGKFIWVPGEPGGRGPGWRGNATWRLNIPVAGTYYLWGRALTPTPDDDSFFIRAFKGEDDIVPQNYWPVGTHTAWEWVPVMFEGEKTLSKLQLPQGEVYLQVMAREDGAKLDRLFITSDANAKPK